MPRYWFFSAGQFQSSHYPSIIRQHFDKFRLCFSEKELTKIETQTENLKHFLSLLSDTDYNKEFFIDISFKKKLKLLTLSEMLFYLDLPAAHVRNLLEKGEGTLEELNSIFLMKKNQNLCAQQIKQHMQEVKFARLVPQLILINITEMRDKHKDSTIEVESSEEEEAIPSQSMSI